MFLSKGNLCALATASVLVLGTQLSFGDDLGCGYLECNSGCLVFRSDGGTTYQFSVAPSLWRGAHRVHITGTVNTNCSPLCSGSTGCIQSPVITGCYATDCVFDATVDFKQGEFINLNPATDQLQVNSWSQTKASDPSVLPYLWVALSGKGAVARIAAVDHYSPVDARCVAVGEVLGAYRTAPDECRGVLSDPSRTTVDFDGNVWVANRSDIAVGNQRRGHVVKIGSGLSYQWVDRNGNGVLDTSSGLGNIRAWTNPDGVCTSGYLGIPGDPNAGDVQYAEDELILAYRVITGDSFSMGTRTVAVDRSNNVWVGGYHNRWHELIDGQTGATLTSIGQQSCGGYGGLVDCAGVLWSARGSNSLPADNELLRFVPSPASSQCIYITNSYGLALNTLGEIWNSRWDQNRSSKLNSAGQTPPLVTTFSTAPDAIWYRGMVVTPDDNDVWTAATGSPYGVTRHASDGALRTIIDLNASGGAF